MQEILAARFRAVLVSMAAAAVIMLTGMLPAEAQAFRLAQVESPATSGTESPAAAKPQNPFAKPGMTVAPQSTPTSAANAGIFARGWEWVLGMQSRLNRDMARAVKDLSGNNPVYAGFMLIAIAFGYGVLHAAGPGHGKAIISSYVLANEQTVRRGIKLSFLAALFQALSAIMFVGIMALILNQTSIAMRSTEATIETVSWGLVAAVGAFLLWRQLKDLWPSRRQADDVGHTHAHHAHGTHEHGPDCGCGHSHMPTPSQIDGQIDGEWSWKRALPIALSVGIRPCSGAILLMIFALSQGMLWAGILGTFAMALGTAITVSILAAMAVYSKAWAMRASGPGSVWANRIQTAAGVGGAALIFGLGMAFFIASLVNPGSPL